MAQTYYDTLWVNKSSSTEDIKKAYRKQAMKYHPDRNKGDKTAEKKFKEVNEAYATLGDQKKKKQYDMFGWTGSGNPFAWWSNGAWYSNADFSGFEDIFSWFWWAKGSKQWASFDFSDLFWEGFQSWQSSYQNWTQAKSRTKSEDTIHTYEVAIFDLILWCKIEIIGRNKKKVKLKVPKNTKPGTKMRVKDLWELWEWKTGNLVVVLEAKMPKIISEVDSSMLERIAENVSY